MSEMALPTSLDAEVGADLGAERVEHRRLRIVSRELFALGPVVEVLELVTKHVIGRRHNALVVERSEADFDPSVTKDSEVAGAELATAAAVLGWLLQSTLHAEEIGRREGVGRKRLAR